MSSTNQMIAAAVFADISTVADAVNPNLLGVRNAVISPESHTKVQSPDVDMTAVMESTANTGSRPQQNKPHVSKPKLPNRILVGVTDFAAGELEKQTEFNLKQLEKQTEFNLKQLEKQTEFSMEQTLFGLRNPETSPLLKLIKELQKLFKLIKDPLFLDTEKLPLLVKATTRKEKKDQEATALRLIRHKNVLLMIHSIVHCNDELTQKIEEAKKSESESPQYTDTFLRRLYSNLIKLEPSQVEKFINSPDKKKFLDKWLTSIGDDIERMELTIDEGTWNRYTPHFPGKYYRSTWSLLNSPSNFPDQEKLAAVIKLGEDLRKLVKDMKKKIEECVNAMEPAAKQDNTQPSAKKEEETK